MKRYKIPEGIVEIKVESDGTMFGQITELIPDERNPYGYSVNKKWIEIKNE
jgi:hypothetical protein